MPTVIDALVVTLGLDPKNFTAGQKQVAAEFLRMKEDAARAAGAVEARGAAIENTFRRMATAALGFGAALLGGRGIVKFAIDMTNMQDETGRTAKILDVSTKTLSAWRGAAVLAGGTTAGVTASIAGLVNQFQNFALTGQSDVIPYFRALDVDIADVSTGKMRSINDILIDLAKAGEKLNPAEAANIFRRMGFDEGTISMLLQGEEATRKLLDRGRELNTVTEEEAASSRRLNEAWQETELTASKFGRTILNELTPALEGLLHRWRDVLDAFNKGKFAEREKQSGQDWLRYFFGYADKYKKTKLPAIDDGLSGFIGDGARSDTDREKPGAGKKSAAMVALKRSLLNEIPGLDRFTSFDDDEHRNIGYDSAHSHGRALDFTVKDPSKYAEVAAQVRANLAARKIDATVLDEKNHPSHKSTAPHIHVQVNSAEAAQRLVEMTGAKAAAANGDVDNSKTSTTTSTTTIGKIEVHTPATDGAGVARGIKTALEGSNGLAQQAQKGPD